MNAAYSLLILCVSCLSMAVGIWLSVNPADAIEMQRRFYVKINWRIEPIFMGKELRNTKFMGFFLIAIGAASEMNT